MLTSISRRGWASLTTASLKTPSSWKRLVPTAGTAIHMINGGGTNYVQEVPGIQYRGFANRRKLNDIESLRLKKPLKTGTMTKIICTIGPATDSPDKMKELVGNGMHVARLNFSHAGADYTYPEKLFNMLRDTKGNHDALTGTGSSTKDMPNNLRAVLVDTKGPEIRTGVLAGNEEVSNIEVDAEVVLTIEDVSNDPIPKEDDTSRKINIDYQSICKTVDVGKLILLDDGLIALEVVEIDPAGKFVVCTALNGGPIKKNKGVNLPGMELDLPALTDKDKRDLKWACEMGADFIAASFIRTGGNVRSVIAYLNRCIAELPDLDGFARIRPLVISKIENKEGVDNFDEILHESDGIMVARGGKKYEFNDTSGYCFFCFYSTLYFHIILTPQQINDHFFLILF
ncbi:MAG: pyruvate kinase [Bacillariaceae sp.]|jgi:pyruvate kinase